MPNEDFGRRSRWMMRAMEWDDARARYPNIWVEGMPRHILAFERVVSRLRLGDLVAVYYPSSQRHPERAEKFLGLSRVAGLRRADQGGFGWIDLETAHRFDPPLALGQQPRRVFLCCDPGWPGPELELFRQVFDAAVAAGWQPSEEEREAGSGSFGAEAADAAGTGVTKSTEDPADAASADEDAPPFENPIEGTATEPERSLATIISAEPLESAEAAADLRMFGGVGYSGDMRDPRDATWLAITELRGQKLRVSRLEATGRHGLQSYLRDAGRSLMNVEAIGLDFPFGLPTRFAEKILENPFPDEGWWALVKKMEKLTRPEYLVAIQEFRDAEGELKRLTDEQADAFSPLQRANPDLGPITFHGIRMIAEDRSRFAIRPFESAQGKLLLEVYPGGSIRGLELNTSGPSPAARSRAILQALTLKNYLPLEMDEPLVRACVASRDALDSVIAARCAAVAVLSGEVEKTPEDLAPGEGERVRREGWIYGLEEPAP